MGIPEEIAKEICEPIVVAMAVIVSLLLNRSPGMDCESSLDRIFDMKSSSSVLSFLLESQSANVVVATVEERAEARPVVATIILDLDADDARLTRKVPKPLLLNEDDGEALERHGAVTGWIDLSLLLQRLSR